MTLLPKLNVKGQSIDAKQLQRDSNCLRNACRLPEMSRTSYMDSTRRLMSRKSRSLSRDAAIRRKSPFVSAKPEGTSHDPEASRLLAEERVNIRRAASAERTARILMEESDARKEVAEKRSQEAEARDQQRAETYARNAILAELARRRLMSAMKPADCDNHGT